jgi:effector-binding domain-containing protein
MEITSFADIVRDSFSCARKVLSSDILSNLLSFGSLVFAVIIYLKAKEIANRFLVSGIHRSPNLGIEIYQDDKKKALQNITLESQTVKVAKLKRKPFLIKIPKKVFDIYNSGEEGKYVRIKAVKIECETIKKTYESLTPEEIFLDGEGVADHMFSSNVLFMDKDSYMVMSEPRMIEVDDYFYYIYINTFQIDEGGEKEIKHIPKGRYLLIFGIDSPHRYSNISKIATEYMELEFK